MDDDLSKLIGERAQRQLWEKLLSDRMNDPALGAKIRSVCAPWVRARLAEGYDADDLDGLREIADGDDILMRKGAKLLAEHYPRLLEREISAVIDDMVSSGELLTGVGDDGETHYRPAED